jgi:hypothetical protein
MAGGAGDQKSILLYHCEEMTDLARQVAARNDDIQLCSISWRSPPKLPLQFQYHVDLFSHWMFGF